MRLTLRDEKLDPDAILDLVDPSVPAGELVVHVSAADPTRLWQVPTGADATLRAEFSDVFLTRYLVAAEQRSWPYLVLVLDQEVCRPHRGSAEELREVKEHGFPDTPAIPSPEDAVGRFPAPSPTRRTRSTCGSTCASSTPTWARH
ncbi:hypothetical protein ACFQ9X_25345 [Catenulispora yoronensis]